MRLSAKSKIHSQKAKWCDLYGITRALDSVWFIIHKKWRIFGIIVFGSIDKRNFEYGADWIITEKCHWLGLVAWSNKSKFHLAHPLFNSEPVLLSTVQIYGHCFEFCSFSHKYICHNWRNFLRILSSHVNRLIFSHHSTWCQLNKIQSSYNMNEQLVSIYHPYYGEKT